MKKESEKFVVNIPKDTHDLLNKARTTDVMRLTLGQMVTKLAYKEYGHLVANEAAVRERLPHDGPKTPAEDWAEQLLDKHNGSKTNALSDIPKVLPLRLRKEIAEAINNALF
ncbi:MAG: hypothetical protein LBU89_00765 [Fibromonadaceae bacterium]|jgi:hypothetical protein|nr:hypothetical protein [Fibromonadaceae bacterium]